MPRTKKNAHTSPDKAGEKNFEGKEMPKADDPSILKNILAMSKEGKEFNLRYKGQWTEEEFAESVSKYIEYVAEHGMKPTHVGLCLWLGMSKSQYYEIKANLAKYGAKSEILKQADMFFEDYLMADLDKHTVGSIFLLKCKHDYVETNKVDVTTNGNSLNDASEVRDLVNKLGLDKK